MTARSALPGRTLVAGLLLVAVAAAPCPAAADPVPEPAAESPAESGDHLWRAWLVQAAPGRLEELLDRLGERLAARAAEAPAKPFWMRHSQGDRWDLLVLLPAGSLPAGAESAAERSAGLAADLDPLISWQADLFVHGPEPSRVAERLAGAGLLHVEIFRALPGRRGDLLDQRVRENDYLAAVGRPRNLIFERVAGGPWDVFTVGPHPDLEAFATAGAVSPEEDDRAAREAGFEGARDIGFHLRELIAEHHDTLAVALPIREPELPDPAPEP